MSSDFTRLGITNKNERTRNKYYKTDVARTLQHTRWLLEILGVWPLVKKNPTTWEIGRSKCLISLCSILMAFIMIPCTLHMILMEKNPLVKLMLFGPIGFCLTNILKYCSIIYRRDIIENCINHVEFDLMRIDNQHDREIMERNVNVGRNLTVLCAVFMYTGGLSYHTIMPLWRGNEINEFNKTIRPLVYPGYDIFFDSQTSPNYEFIFYTNCISACVTYTITTAACNLAAVFVAHTCGQIEIMMSRLRTLFDGTDDIRNTDILHHRLGFVIHSHTRVLRFTSIIETLLREICLVEVVASTLIICLLEYYCLTEWENSETIAIITYLVLLLSLSFNIYIFCHIGELLKEQCQKIGKAAYMMNWYRLPSKSGRALVMVLAISNYPRKLTAGRMMELSVRSFGTIIKTSVIYLNMLRAMAD
ncbi:odorant receptor 4-like [Venturia canescens]|uniref:odorant receptor 4-like n=1 Tax=Venturia canescens TaxID=32260 RepID=UPI001C9C2256|nr:odorant receptor 4-like [Venturia canescens]